MLDPITFLFDTRTVDWFDVMYSILQLKPGKTFSISAFYPEELKKEEIDIIVHPTTELVDIDGKIFSAFVCNVGSPTQIHYVSGEGQLLIVEKPYENVTIKLKTNNI